MNPQYTLVNECISVLQEKKIKPIHKLRFEVQLIKLKDLLLQRDLDDVTADHFIVSLLAFSRNITVLEGDEISSAAFEEMNRELQRIADVVAGWATPT